MGTTEDRQLGRVLWRSRRGMLELDLLLAEFAREAYPRLDEARQNAYRGMLELDDWVLLDWLRGRAVPPPPFVDIVATVAAFNARRGPS